MSLLKALTPTTAASRFGRVVAVMLDGSYRVDLGGITRRMSSLAPGKAGVGSQVVIQSIAGKEVITAIGTGTNTTITGVTING